MAVFAHPDDPEFFAGATFARWAAEGAEITFVLATSGDKGSDDPEMTHERLIVIREGEERNAAAELGVKDVVFLRYPDGELQPTLELRRDIARMIRLRKPDIVVTCDPTVFWFGDGYVNHPDHRAIGQATLDAVFPTAGNRLYFIEMERDEGLKAHKIRQLYISGTVSPNKKIDVAGYIDAQIASLRQHKSQIKNMDEMAEWMRKGARDPESPDDAPRYIESFRVMTFET
jgi:LmbE family N-acetylglucosaminyl deacetylase